MAESSVNKLNRLAADPEFHALPEDQQKLIVQQIMAEQDSGLAIPDAAAAAMARTRSAVPREPFTPMEAISRNKFVPPPLQHRSLPGLLENAEKQFYSGTDAMQGAQDWSQFLGGASNAARGMGTMTAPFYGPQMILNPIRTGFGVVGGLTGQYGGQKAAEALKAGPGTSQFAGDVTGALTGLISSIPGGMLQNFLYKLPEILKDRKLQELTIKALPFIKGQAINEWRNALWPPPAEDQPFQPFKPSTGTARRMPYTASGAETGMPSGGGGTTARKPAYGSDIPLSPNLPTPEETLPFEPFQINPKIAKKMPFTPSGEQSGMPSGGGKPTPREPAYGPDVPLTPGAAPPEAPVSKFEPFRINPRLAKKMTFTPSRGESGMPPSRPVKVRSKPLTPPPAPTEEEAAAEGVKVTPEGQVLTPAWKAAAGEEALIKQQAAERAAAQKPAGAETAGEGGKLYSKTKNADEEITSQIHKMGRELDLPGSPAGKTWHATPTVKEVYGKDATWSGINTEQKAALNRFMHQHKRPPTQADVKSGLFQMPD